LFRWRWAFERRARGARYAAATILLQGPHFDHVAKVAAFAVFGVFVTERVKHIGYLLREGLDDVEAVAANCRWISCRKNTGYHATDPKDSNAGG
jgi:hypothetical protein